MEGLVKKQAKFAQDVAKLLQYINDKGYICTFGEAYRTPEQAAIYAQEGKGIKNSLHTSRLAIDLNLFDKELKYHGEPEFYRFVAEYWKSLDPANRAGLDFPKLVDANHFERNPSCP